MQTGELCDRAYRGKCIENNDVEDLGHDRPTRATSQNGWRKYGRHVGLAGWRCGDNWCRVSYGRPLVIPDGTAKEESTNKYHKPVEVKLESVRYY